MFAASIVVIGDEILEGFVRDENSPWLSVRLRERGVPLRRIQTVPDEHAAIAAAIRDELDRARPLLVVTSGGIGSTPDDITYEAVARCLERELVVAPALADRLGAMAEWTREQGYAVDDRFVDDLMRMARVPAGATLLQREGSWVPAVRVDVDGGIDAGSGATVVILPGVPWEFRALVTEVVEPRVLAGRGTPEDVVEVTHGFPESVLNACLVRVAERYPRVRVGSYPGVPMLVRLRGPAEDVDGARAEVEGYVRELEAEPAGARLRAAWAGRHAPDEVEA